MGATMPVMPRSDPKADLQRYLQRAREALLWKLDGLSEYDVRRPLVPSGTNLLGLVKHLATAELGYFAASMARPPGDPLPGSADAPKPTATRGPRPDERAADTAART